MTNFAPSSRDADHIPGAASPGGESHAGAPTTRAAFEGGRLYPTDSICAIAGRESAEYTERLLFDKLETVGHHIQDGLLVDLCCATGDHIAQLLRGGQSAVGIDFSLPFLEKAAQSAGEGVTFLAADARALPLADGSAGTLYSLSALYLVPDLDRVIGEVARVLRPGGRCVLDLGNRDSLNSFCVRNYYPELPVSYHLPVAEMLRLCEHNRLRILEHRAFQLLPLWAGRPRWLWLLLHPAWKRIMSKRIGGRMIDEWISGWRPLRRFAFRHLLVCEKVG